MDFCAVNALGILDLNYHILVLNANMISAKPAITYTRKTFNPIACTLICFTEQRMK
jgi:hypothetical protein